MKFAKTAALGALAAAALVGSTAFAATATPTANAHPTCSQQAKDKHLAGAARKSFVKKCRADAPKK